MRESRGSIRVLLLDIGGVVLTDAWDRHARERASRKFGLDLAEMNERHHILFETHELGKISFKEYLDQLVFHMKRPFTRAQFRRFIFEQSKPHPEMIGLIAQLKDKNRIKIAALNNEAREINGFRIQEFKLDRIVDYFISSCFVHLRKPDPDIFQLALDIAHASPREAVYIDDTAILVHNAERLGIRSVHHRDYRTTREKLASFGLET